MGEGTRRRKLKILPTHGRYLLTNALFNDDERLRLLLEAWPSYPRA